MIYITFADYVVDSIGVIKKVKAQYKVFKNVFGRAYYTLYRGQIMYLLENDTIVEKKLAITPKDCVEVIIDWMKKYRIRKSYIRYEYTDRWFLQLLQYQKQLEVKSVLEFPTIPYDDAWGGSSYNVLADRYYRERLHNYVECCTTYGDYNEVFRIPCIVLANGVDIEEHKKKRYREKDGKIILLAVATMAKWHGYERILQGMEDYYANGGERNFIFNIVGDGGQIQYYGQLTEEYRLQKHVVFHGQLSGKKLDEIYNSSDIAVGSLGAYKVKIQSASPMKTAEYCARGIPFIYGYDDISLRQDNYFTYKISNDATPVDMHKIIEFYEAIYDGRDFIKDIRQYTLLNLTWDKIMQPVIEYLS